MVEAGRIRDGICTGLMDSDWFGAVPGRLMGALRRKQPGYEISFHRDRDQSYTLVCDFAHKMPSKSQISDISPDRNLPTFRR